jgi:hypothetical protein
MHHGVRQNRKEGGNWRERRACLRIDPGGGVHSRSTQPTPSPAPLFDQGLLVLDSTLEQLAFVDAGLARFFET